MIMFYDELRKPLSTAEALYAAQQRMRTLTAEKLGEIIDEVERQAIHSMTDDKFDLNEYVHNPRYHIGQLKRQDVEELRDKRYWAAFVLTGYGSREIYPEGLEEGG
jgi:CHAT domain-containing protein